jgi:hypothetical protein
MKENWKPVKGECPRCGKPDWCKISADGTTLMCRREPTGSVATRTDRGGVTYYLHRLTEGPNGEAAVTMAKPSKTPERASVETLNRVYSAAPGRSGVERRPP